MAGADAAGAGAASADDARPAGAAGGYRESHRPARVGTDAGRGRARLNGPWCSAQTSAAGSTSITPNSDTREVHHREDPEVPQHPDVGRDQHGEARYGRGARRQHRSSCGRVGQLDRPGGRRAGVALLAVAGGQQDAELGGDRDHERAQRHGHRIELDREGTRQQAEHEQQAGRPARGECDRDERHGGLAAAAAQDQQHQEDRRQRSEEHERSPRRVRQRRVGVRGQHGQAHHRRRPPRPAGRVAP